MLFKKIFWRVTSIIGTIAIIGIVPLSIALANKYATKKHYDFGLAVPKVNSLNFIKYGGPVGQLAGSLMEGPIEDGPKDSLKNYLQLDHFNGNVFHMSKKGAVDQGRVYPFSDSGISSGSLLLGETTKSLISIADDSNKVYDVFMRLNGKSKWRSGDAEWDNKHSRKVEAKDYVDSAKAIMNLTNGSQRMTNLKDSHIKGVQDAYVAQFEYYKKHKEIYKTPFDGKLKKDGTLGVSDFKLGITSGKKVFEKEKIGESEQTALDVVRMMIPEKERLNNKNWGEDIVHYSFETPSDYFQFLRILMTPTFYPINKEFIKDHGGLEHFGDSAKDFIWNGAFDIDSLILGDQGSMTLKKSSEYFNASKVIPNNIKLYFQEDNVVKGSMFDDGKISFTRVPPIYQMKFWSDAKKRKYMRKNVGFGTIALSLNLDKETNGDSPLQDENLRKAISYSINRKRILKYAGWNNSFPVVTWTAFGNAKDSKARPIESHWGVEKHGNKWTGEVFQTENGKTFPIQNINWEEHSVKRHIFEHSNRNDTGFDPETSKYFFKKYREAHPNVKQVTLTYVDPGNAESKKVMIGLQNLLRNQFGNFIKLKEKTLPSNVFSQFQLTGKFDIIYHNFDHYGTELSSYIKRFLLPDGIVKSNYKNTGFRDNPAGSWTYTDFKNKRKDKKTWESIKRQINASDDIWEKVNSLIPDSIPKNEIKREDIKKKFEAFFAAQDKKNDDNFIVSVAAAFEKIIRISSPVIPLMEVDTYWRISRLNGLDSLQNLTLKYVYDVENKPLKNLPGGE